MAFYYNFTVLVRYTIFEYYKRHVWCDGFYFSDEIIFSRGLTWDDTASIDWITVHRLVRFRFITNHIFSL